MVLIFKLQGISKATKILLSELSTKEDIADVLCLYHDFSNQSNIADAVSLEDQQPSLHVKFGEYDDDSDPGVENESSMSPDMLADNLGFPGGLPLLFNKYRHRGGLSPWDSETVHLFDDDAAQDDEDMIPFMPHWHQLAGTHAIFRKVFNLEQDKSACTGMLIADDVGLGKTCQASMVIAALADAIQLQQDGKNLPPLLGALLSAIFVPNTYNLIASHPYLAHRKVIPNRPVLIIVPGTLLNQWSTEFKLLVNPKAFDVFVYGVTGQSPKAFWADNGPFLKSNQPLSCRIIIASHSVSGIKISTG